MVVEGKLNAYCTWILQASGKLIHTIFCVQILKTTAHVIKFTNAYLSCTLQVTSVNKYCEKNVLTTVRIHDMVPQIVSWINIGEQQSPKSFSNVKLRLFPYFYLHILVVAIIQNITGTSKKSMNTLLDYISSKSDHK